MSALIGRDRELGALTHALSSASRGSGCCVLLEGEAGIGKSRLVAELRAQAAAGQFVILEGHCFEQDLLFPYAPWIDALRTFLALKTTEETSQLLGTLAPDLAKLLPELTLLIPAAQPVSVLNPEADNRRLFEVVVRFGISLAASHPLLLILEDLHWSDEQSLDLLQFFLRRISSLPILVVSTARSEEISTQLSRHLIEMRREHLMEEIRLPPLVRLEVDQMARGILKTDPLAGHQLDLLMSWTEGNPFFVEEVLKGLVETGEERNALERLQIPGSIRDMVQRRVADLPEDVQRVLTMASVVGERFDFGLLQEITLQSELQLLGMLKELIASRLIVEVSADQFAFRHALTRQAVYARLMQRERKSIHQLIGETMERAGGGRTEAEVAQLAYHFHQAGEWQKALEYSQRAGEQAQALYAPREALAHFTHALEAAHRLTPAPPEGTQVRLYRGRAHAREVWGDFDGARDDYEAALALARRGVHRADEWQTLIDLGLLWQSRDLERAGEYYRGALELAHQLEDPAFLAQSLNRIGNWNMNRGRVGEALPAHRAALELFRKADHRRGMAQTLELLGLVSYQFGDFSQGTAYLEQAVPILRELEDRQGLVNTLSNLVFRGRFETEVWGDTDCLQLVKLSEEALAIARSANWPQGEARALIQGAGILAKIGDFSRALEWLGEAESLTEESQSRESFARLHMTYVSVFFDLLALSEARQHLDTVIAAAQELGSRLLGLSATAAHVRILIFQGELARARELLDLSLPAEYPKDQVLTPVRLLWSERVELELAQGHPSPALEIVEWLLGSTMNLAQYGSYAVPHLSHLRARALAALSRMAEAEGELQGALPIAHRQGQQTLQWRLHADLGKVYRAMGRRADAKREFSAARTIIRELTNRIPEGSWRDNFLKQVSTVVPGAPVLTPRQIAKKEFGGLTEREREIATLIARGKSNRDIANELVISEKTAERHISNILLKLQFTSRAQIAAWAVQKGLNE